ncbi:hypothetical protein GGS26DRAFT_249622 [Hypomontagnella submonticulosa]|nr:hypothetical protein GGS26DRAFT_249622 [Hypomontagnella submonticulosa]
MNDELLCSAITSLASLAAKSEIFDKELRDWASVCQLVDFDFNVDVAGRHHFLVRVVVSMVDSIEVDNIENYMKAFDSIVSQRIGIASSDGSMDIPMTLVGNLMWGLLKADYGKSLVAHEASPTLSASYRGYYMHPNLACQLVFLEHVISKGIAENPDSIFIAYHGWTISDMFYGTPWQHIWEEILEEHGFDVGWVYEEDERRARVITGETSAHEVSVGADTSRALEVKRRRGYENTDD